MGERFRRYVDAAIAKDPDLFLASTRFMRRGVRLLLTERRYARELVSTGLAWERGGLHREALLTYDEIVALRGNRTHGPRAMALSGQAYCRSMLDDHEGAVAAAEEAVSLLEPLAVERPGRFGPFLFQAWWVLGIVRYNLGRLAEAVPALAQYLRMARALPVEPASNVSALRALANAHLRLDQPVEALPYVEELVEVLHVLAATEPATRADELANALDLERECRDQVVRDAAPPRGT